MADSADALRASLQRRRRLGPLRRCRGFIRWDGIRSTGAIHRRLVAGAGSGDDIHRVPRGLDRCGASGIMRKPGGAELQAKDGPREERWVVILLGLRWICSSARHPPSRYLSAEWRGNDQHLTDQDDHGQQDHQQVKPVVSVNSTQVCPSSVIRVMHRRHLLRRYTCAGTERGFFRPRQSEPPDLAYRARFRYVPACRR